MMKKLFAFTAIVLVVLGVNYSAVYIHRNAIKSAIESLQLELKNYKVEFNYKELEFSGLFALEAKCVIKNPSISGSANHSSVTSSDAIIILSRPLEKEVHITAEGGFHELVTHEEKKIADLLYSPKDMKIDIKFNDSFSSLLSSSKKSVKDVLGALHEARYIDNGFVVQDFLSDGQVILQYDGASATLKNNSALLGKNAEDSSEDAKKQLYLSLQASVASCHYNAEHPDKEVKHMATSGKSTFALDCDYILGSRSGTGNKEDNAIEDKNNYECIECRKLNIINDLFSIAIEGKAGFNITEKRPIVEGKITIHEMPTFVKFYVGLFNLMLSNSPAVGALEHGIKDDQIVDLIALLEKLAIATDVPGRSELRITSQEPDDSTYQLKISGVPAMEVLEQLKGVLMRNPATALTPSVH